MGLPNLTFPRTFLMERVQDETGVSGTGIVLEGIIFVDGRVALRWKGETRSTVVYDSYDDFCRIHIISHPTNGSVVYFSDGVTLSYSV